jgi:hypothetical protein
MIIMTGGTMVHSLCTDPWGTSMANLRGAVYYVLLAGEISRLIDNSN